MAEDPRIGSQIAGYRIERRIGRGGMGLVYLAEHLHLQRMVALKLLAPEIAASEGFRERFLRESRMAASLHHPNIVTVYDAGQVDDSLYIAMQFVDGVDLATVLEREGPLGPERTLSILGDVGYALDAAHAGGLVHRDVKPGNILLDGDRAYLTDFGLTRRTDSKSGFTKTGQFLGTIDYVAPEQIEGREVDGRTDIYALGCVLYECLIADKPYARDSDLAVIYAHIQSEPPRLAERRPDLAALDQVVQRALAKSKEDRWENCTAMITTARGALGGPAATAGPAPTRPAPEPPPVVTKVAAPDQQAEAPRRPEPAPTQASPRAAAPEPQPTAPLPTDGPDRPTGPTAALPAARAPRRRVPLLPIAIGAALVALVVVGLLLVAGGGDEEGGGGGGGGGDQAPAGTTFPVGERPFGVAVEEGSVYVVGQGDNSITRLLPDGSGRTQQSVGAGPFWVSGGNQWIWVTNRDENSVTRLDREDLTVQPPISVGSAPYWILVRDGTVWIVNGDDDTVTRLDETSGEPLGTPIEVGAAPRAVGVRDGSAWVTNGDDDTVTRIDAASGEVVGEPIPVGSHPVGLSIDFGFVWVANEGDNSVSRIDAETGEPVGDAIPVGQEPFDVATGEGAVWVTNAADDTVTKIDPDTARVVGDPIEVGNQPTGITAAGGYVWVALNDANAVQRIEP